MTLTTPHENPDSVPIGFLAGNWVPHGQLTVSVDDTGFRQGVTAVERLRTYHQSIFAADAHLSRWQHSTAELEITGLPSKTTIKNLLQELLDRNQTLLDAEGELGITLFATPGAADVGTATFGMHVNRLNSQQNRQRRESGQPLIVTPIQQPAPECWPRTIKIRSRVHYHLADLAAHREDPAASGILLDSDNTVTETSIANLAIVIDGKIISPPADRVLGGITQGVMEQLAEELQIPWSKCPISVPDLMDADEVLLMGTDGGLWFANTVNGNAVGKDRTKLVYPQLQGRFKTHVASSAR